MLKPLVLLVDDEAPFVETMAKRLSKRVLNFTRKEIGPTTFFWYPRGG
jgi:hypothetical protein